MKRMIRMNIDAAADAVQPLIIAVLAVNTQPIAETVEASATSAVSTISSSLKTDELRGIGICFREPLRERLHLLPG